MVRKQKQSTSGSIQFDLELFIERFNVEKRKKADSLSKGRLKSMTARLRNTTPEK